MRCPFCSMRDSRVIDTRELGSGDSIRRRRECVGCGRRFTTYERVESTGLLVVKRDARREEFSQAKLREKLRLAMTKRPVGEAEIDKLVQQVESDMLALGTPEVASADIGEAVLRRLKDVDQVAYIRFASVYRRFADIDELRRAVDGLGTKAGE